MSYVSLVGAHFEHISGKNSCHAKETLCGNSDAMVKKKKTHINGQYKPHIDFLMYVKVFGTIFYFADFLSSQYGAICVCICSRPKAHKHRKVDLKNSSVKVENT